jgi:predicted RNA-binding protein
MNKLFLLIMILLMAAFSFAQQEQLGAEFTVEEKTEIADILAQPQDFLGRRVLIEAEVVDVCANMGCWMDLRSADNSVIKVKVKDGDIIFPTEAKGHTALVEGEVYQIDLDEESAKEYFAHMAEDAGTEFDESTVTGPVTIYQIKGLGAAIDFDKKAEAEVKAEEQD